MKRAIWNLILLCCIGIRAEAADGATKETAMNEKLNALFSGSALRLAKTLSETNSIMANGFDSKANDAEKPVFAITIARFATEAEASSFFKKSVMVRMVAGAKETKAGFDEAYRWPGRAFVGRSDVWVLNITRVPNSETKLAADFVADSFARNRRQKPELLDELVPHVKNK